MTLKYHTLVVLIVKGICILTWDVARDTVKYYSLQLPSTDKSTHNLRNIVVITISIWCPLNNGCDIIDIFDIIDIIDIMRFRLF